MAVCTQALKNRSAKSSNDFALRLVARKFFARNFKFSDSRSRGRRNLRPDLPRPGRGRVRWSWRRFSGGNAAGRAFPPAHRGSRTRPGFSTGHRGLFQRRRFRSEEHTSELQSLRHLVCRLLLEKKKKKNK